MVAAPVATMHPLDDDDLSGVRGGFIGGMGMMGGMGMIGMIPQLISMFGGMGKKSNGTPSPQQQVAQAAAPQAMPQQGPQQMRAGGDSGDPEVSVEVSQGIPLSVGAAADPTRTIDI